MSLGTDILENLKKENGVDMDLPEMRKFCNAIASDIESPLTPPIPFVCHLVLAYPMFPLPLFNVSGSISSPILTAFALQNATPPVIIPIVTVVSEINSGIKGTFPNGSDDMFSKVGRAAAIAYLMREV